MRTLLPVFLLLIGNVYAQVSQIKIPRIEQMPNQPAPYNVRDWKQVAMQYDTFVYDITHSGQYLPLIDLQSGGYNYPDYPAFGLHTYVGTVNPGGNEAINVLPSLVGASLIGIDKQNQFSRNWIRMSQDFFSKRNGLGIYLNNKGGGSGSDWWYDLMPNVYFYQLYDLYRPGSGSEAEKQFFSVAEKFLASVRALGGSETPWQKGNFDYRAFNFQTMQPNPNGVHEPEAAGAYAWVLYRAYLKSGVEAYRKGAEWALEFLNEWQANPSYELQLPYGTLTAARMNAELGTTYNIEKILNWSFDRGALRGWGTIVGKWGSFDCSGLVGEANDNGNDYAFQLNGVQQAAALVPLVRYDKRFARAIGKWMLNLSNATRLFFPGFLASNYQDAAVWSGTYDPERVMGYEALREKYQGLSPYSTGDALKGGWAATNLSLYSTGSIGYLGSIVNKTNVDKILQLDLLATDFFKAEAYPTFLYYNPYESDQTITLDVGLENKDLYDAITEQFVASGVSGIVELSIPADGVLMVSLVPAGGDVSYDQNKMLVNGVVVDYMQSAQNWIKGPRIQALAATAKEIEKGGSTSLFAKVQAGDAPQLNYSWTATGGILDANGDEGTWTTLSDNSSDTIHLIVSDANGLSDTTMLVLNAVPEINRAPQISAIVREQAYLAPSTAMQIACEATDPNGDELSFEWSAQDGSISGTGATINWNAPGTEGIYEISVRVSDGRGLLAEAKTKLLVKNFTAAAGKLIAHYPLAGNAYDITDNQLHGIPFNVAYVPDADGKTQEAMYFNGVNSRVTVNNEEVLNPQEGISVMAWFRANELPAKETFLLSHGSWQNRWKISFTPEKRLRWTVNTTGGIGDLDTDFAMQTDSFYHVTATFDGQLLMVYVNGTLQSFKVLNGNIRSTTLPLLMGQMLPGNTEYNFKGVLDEVKIFDYALHPESIKQLFDQSSGTVAYNTPPLWEIALSVSPNPAGENISIALEGQKNIGLGLLTVYDLSGSIYHKQTFPSSNKLDISLSGWPAGAYIVVLKTAKGLGKTMVIKR